MANFVEEFHKIEVSEEIYDRIKKDYYKDSPQTIKEKNDVSGIFFTIERYLEKTDKELEYEPLWYIEDQFTKIKKEISHHVEETELITPKTADILEKIMEKTIARRKSLPPYDPDRFGWNDPYIKLPWPFSESILEQDKHLFKCFLYDPKTQSYVYGKKNAIKEQNERAEAFHVNKKQE